ncbi:hypothetical protein EFN30_09245 [Propionibacterium freudenreichii]|nr:hypothetical protein [Propionibacterium freudenreichii]
MAPAVALAVARGRAVAVVPTVAGEVAGDDVEGTAVVVEATPGVAPAVGGVAASTPTTSSRAVTSTAIGTLPKRAA